MILRVVNILGVLGDQPTWLVGKSTKIDYLWVLGGAMNGARDDSYFPILNEERFRNPESSKSQGSWANASSNGPCFISMFSRVGARKCSIWRSYPSLESIKTMLSVIPLSSSFCFSSLFLQQSTVVWCNSHVPGPNPLRQENTTFVLLYLWTTWRIARQWMCIS